MVWVVVFGYSSHIHGESFTFLQQDTFLWACLGWRIEPSAPWRRFSSWLKLSQGIRLKLQSTVSDGNPSCLFWSVYNGCQTRYCTSTHSYWNVNSGLAESVLERRRDLKLSVQSQMLSCCVLQYKLRWDFPCQLILDEQEWKECILRGEICNCRDAGAFHNGS